MNYEAETKKTSNGKLRSSFIGSFITVTMKLGKLLGQFV